MPARLENMFLKFLKYKHFIGQSEHVFKNVFFIVAPAGEFWSENFVKKRLFFAKERLKKNPIFRLQLSAGRQERINYISRCVGFCGG